ncbi:hypothetical protein Nepgr_023035 [Nepenthes gracilis]|uniref:Uncharacterized protein n=1 Tax=Nepenthes gracilis TaxID=150966 RepID=A0AAD3XXJ0_NEPGR|nr:hypothetical protein Nepgr_023035 [Nepenthes gracilis]
MLICCCVRCSSLQAIGQPGQGDCPFSIEAPYGQPRACVVVMEPHFVVMWLSLHWPGLDVNVKIDCSLDKDAAGVGICYAMMLADALDTMLFFVMGIGRCWL